MGRRKKVLIIQICQNCGHEFTNNRNTPTKCCNDVCRKEYLNKPEIKLLTVTNTRNSMMEKYGVDHPSKLPDFKLKLKRSKLEKYGDENYVNVDKCKSTKLDRYGDSSYNNRNKSKKNEFENLLEKLHLRNITLISESAPLRYRNDSGIHDVKFDFKCNVCNNKFESWLSSGHIPVCNVCFPSNKIGTKTKNEILTFLQSNYSDKITTDTRKILTDHKEIDFYLPDINLAIEYDGIIWHSENYGNKSINYHLNKTMDCKLRNISLIHIFENEWINKKNVVKSIILNRLGKTNKIFARKCDIKIVSDDEKCSFLNENHLQGNCQSSINLGLFYNEELIQLMTFSKSRFDKKYEYELTRFCNKTFTSVIGGSQRLMKYFLSHHNVKSIVSYSDIRYFLGSFYEKLGFKYISQSKPNYYYFKYSDQHNLINRVNFQKHKLEKKLKSFDIHLTEWENMKLNGYDRIWDCGNYKYELILK